MIYFAAIFLTLVQPAETVRGRVLYEGPIPVPQQRTVDVNTGVCGAKRPIMFEDLLVSPDFGLANTAAILLGVPLDAQNKPPPKEAQLQQENCVFIPHVQTVTLGDQVAIGNSDPVIHNVHARIGETTLFNLGMPLKGVTVKRPLGAPGVASLRCDSGHMWMDAYLVIVPHRYHATTGRDGEFVIEDVPPGEYLLRTWHEKLGVIDTPLAVKSGEEAAPRIVYSSEGKYSTELSFEPPRPRDETHAETPVEAPHPEPSAAFAALIRTNERRAAREIYSSAGRTLYRQYCATCHGDQGDGRGEAASALKTRPRDFRRGEFKFRSTRSGSLPTEDDLFRTISAGIPGTDMPAWKNILSAEERRKLARYVTTFSDRFIYAPALFSIAVPKQTRNDAASVERGRKIYAKLQCAQCHGIFGDAKGVAEEMFDDWGNPIEATDLTRGVYKAGPTPESRYRTLVTGLSGTPMPAFADLINPEETWDLVHYIDSLAQPGAVRTILGVP